MLVGVILMIAGICTIGAGVHFLDASEGHSEGGHGVCPGQFVGFDNITCFDQCPADQFSTDNKHCRKCSDDIDINCQHCPGYVLNAAGTKCTMECGPNEKKV